MSGRERPTACWRAAAATPASLPPRSQTSAAAAIPPAAVVLVLTWPTPLPATPARVTLPPATGVPAGKVGPLPSAVTEADAATHLTMASNTATTIYTSNNSSSSSNNIGAACPIYPTLCAGVGPAEALTLASRASSPKNLAHHPRRQGWCLTAKTSCPLHCPLPHLPRRQRPWQQPFPPPHPRLLSYCPPRRRRCTSPALPPSTAHR